MPSPHEPCEVLLHDAGCSPDVIAHCRAVRDCAYRFAGNNPLIDRPLVGAGAMLHDIGRGSTHSIAHAQAGADWCRAIGIPEPLARIVERHTGAGLTPDECTLLGLLPRDCMPGTIEERIVAHADNLINGTRRVTIHTALASAVHLKKKARYRMYRLALDVEIFCKN